MLIVGNVSTASHIEHVTCKRCRAVYWNREAKAIMATEEREDQ